MLTAQAARPVRGNHGPAPVFTLNPAASLQRLFTSPAPQGRRITAGFSYIQRIGKSAALDVWFPADLRQRLDALLAQGVTPGPGAFPAEWAALRQFELLQEGGNYKIYDLDATHMTRSMVHLARDMRAGGYRVTVAGIGGYSDDVDHDDLQILDLRLQDRLSRLIHMLYMEEESTRRNADLHRALAADGWDYRTALPHIGATLGARDLFRRQTPPQQATVTQTIPVAPHRLQIDGWQSDGGVCNAVTGQAFVCVQRSPANGEYKVSSGLYEFAPADAGRSVTVTYTKTGDATGGASAKDRKHQLAKQFFNALSLLPARHIVHDTAIGLQLPEAINENEWIYVSPGDETLASFNRLLSDVFTPFDRVSLGALQGRADAGSEPRASMQHLRGTGDRLTPGAAAFYRGLAQYAL